METNENKENSAKDTARIESFSDGVFAIAITLLILDIHVPDVKGQDTILNALLNQWTTSLAFLIGFFTILICWINHHYMFQHIYRSNSMFLLINGFKLLVVTVTPFVTAILSKYIGTEQQQMAVSIYCFNFTLMGSAMFAIWSYANFKGFTRSSDPMVLKATTRLYMLAGTFSTLIWIVSFFSVTACLILSGIMFMIFIFPKKAVLWQVERMTASLM
jgi:uncharacterized membrane protein